MNRFNFFLAFALALTASSSVFAFSSKGAYSAGSSASDASAYSNAGSAGSDYSLQSLGGGAEAAGSSAAASSSDSASYAHAPPAPGYGSHQNVPYSPGNTRGNTVTSSITYPQNKGEILIHRPAPIIVKRPPTKVLVNHPPLVVKPAPVVLHKPPAVVVRKVYVKHHPRPVKVEPVYVNVVKPPAEKYFVKEQQQHHHHHYNNHQAPAGYQQHGSSAPAGSGYGPAGPDAAAAQAGYQLLDGNQGLSVLAGIAPGSYGQSAPSGY